MTDVTSAEVAGSMPSTLEATADDGAVAAPEVASASFDDFQIADTLRSALAAMGYEQPTEVQAEVIAPALAGRDLVVQSKTGSGKTTAFGIPMIQMIEGGSAGPGAPIGMVLTPTRELANQVALEMGRLAEQKGVKILPIYGGVSMGRQISSLNAGVDIVVGTPGRVRDHIRRKNLDLGQCKMICLDEADEMLSMGFWDDVTDLIKMVPSGRQTMLFSATLPYQVAKAAAEFLKDPARLDLSGDSLTVEGIDNHVIHVVPEIPKPRQLLYLLETEQPSSAIVFCNTRNETDMIAKYLTQAGFIAEAISGNFRQNEREAVMAQIKSGELRYMIATDVASRGIDISNLSHVVNYSLPEFTEVYLHRVGRTGRIGKNGIAISLVDGKGLTTLTELERQYNISFTERHLPPENEVLARRKERIMQNLSEKASVAEVGQHIDIAKEIIASEDNQQVVAFLLKAYFASQAGGKARANAAASASSNGSSARSDSPRSSSSSSASSSDDAQGGEVDANGRRRRRRRRRGGGTKKEGDTMDVAQALAGEQGLPPRANPNPVAGNGNGNGQIAPAPEGFARVRVNIGFDDGFKGRGAVAKKITALAGLNDGIVTEVESRREYAVLQAAPDIAELLIERVDGAQIGKKIVSVAAAN